jgi:hypothetical protein
MQKLFKCQTRYHMLVTANRTFPIARRSAQVGLATSKNQACDLDRGSSMIGEDIAVFGDSRCLPFASRRGWTRPEPDWLSCTVGEGKEVDCRFEALWGLLKRRFLSAFMARSSWLRTNGKEVELMGNLFVCCLSSRSTAAPDWFCGDLWDTERGK